jgi:membrane-associated phospholipid phosphatase
MGTDIRPGIRFARAAVPAILVVAVLIAVGFVLSSATGWTSREMDFLRSVNRLHTPGLDWLALGIDWLFGPPVALILVALGTVVVGATLRARSAVQFIVIVVAPWLGTEAVKLIVHRPRPDIPSLAHPLVLEPGGLSYPSGHTTFATCLALGIVIVVGGSRWRPVLIVGAVVVSIATAGSRVYLGVHYPTDVTASIVYSIAAVTFVQALWVVVAVPRGSGRRPLGDTQPAYRETRDAS